MLDPLGVVSGMVFSVATRASREVRSKWIESIGRDRVARLPSGLNPVPPACISPSEPRQSNLEPAVNPDPYRQMYGSVPLQPDGVSRVWGANSFAQQIARRMSCLKGLDTALNSGV